MKRVNSMLRTCCALCGGCFQVFLTHTHLCIAMDYAEGGNLKDYLGENDIIGEEHARWLFQQLVLGVDYCHRMVRLRDSGYNLVA